MNGTMNLLPVSGMGGTAGGAAAEVLAKRGVTTASLMEELKAMGIQAFMSKVFTNHQAEDAMVKVLYILGTIESNKETIEASI